MAMIKPFVPIPLVQKSVLQRLFKQEPAENAVISLNNMLAERDILSINSTELQDLEAFYNIRFATDFELNLQ